MQEKNIKKWINKKQCDYQINKTYIMCFFVLFI